MTDLRKALSSTRIVVNLIKANDIESLEHIKDKLPEFVPESKNWSLPDSAARHDKVDVFNKFVEWGHIPTFVSIEHLAYNGRLPTLKKTVKKFPELNKVSEMTLNYAAKNGHLHVLKWLIENTRYVNEQGEVTETNCSCNTGDLAVEKNHLKVLMYLRQLFIDSPERFSSDCFCTQKALLPCAKSNDVKTLEFLVKIVGLSVTEEVITEAARYGSLNVLKYIYEKLHISADSSTDPLNQACIEGHLKTAKYIRHQMNGYCTRSAMAFAARSNHLSIIRFLNKEMKKVGKKDYVNFVEDSTGDYDIVTKTDKHHKVWDEWPINWACEFGHLKVVKLLNEKCKLKYTNYALEAASRNGQTEVIKYILKAMPECKVTKKITNETYGRKQKELVIKKFKETGSRNRHLPPPISFDTPPPPETNSDEERRVTDSDFYDNERSDITHEEAESIGLEIERQNLETLNGNLNKKEKEI